jgi:hypothetical protein
VFWFSVKRFRSIWFIFGTFDLCARSSSAFALITVVCPCIFVPMVFIDVCTGVKTSRNIAANAVINTPSATCVMPVPNAVVIVAAFGMC